MKKIAAICLLWASLCSGQEMESSFGQTTAHFPLQDLVEQSRLQEAEARQGVRFFWGDTPLPYAIDEDIKTVIYSQASNAFMRTARKSCLNALVDLIPLIARDAQRYGANAVIEVRGTQEGRNDPALDYSSRTQYECQPFGVASRVTLRVRFVRMAVPTTYVSAAPLTFNALPALPNDCTWATTLQAELAAASHPWRPVALVPNAGPVPSAEARRLQLTVLDIKVPASGRKSMRLTGNLQDGTRTLNFSAYQNTILGGDRPCDSLTRMARRHAETISEWLQNPQNGVALGDRD